MDMYLCPPHCEKLHREYEVCSMFGVFDLDLRKLVSYGLLPAFKDEESLFYYRCQDIQRAAYELEGSITVKTHLNLRYGIKPYWDERHYWEKWSVGVRDEIKIRSAFDRPGFVYLMKWEAYYKIGCSKNAEKRRENICRMPVKVEIVHTVFTQDMFRSEGFLHRLFDYYRVDPKREWFQLPLHLIRWICNLKSGEIDEHREAMDIKRTRKKGKA